MVIPSLKSTLHHCSTQERQKVLRQEGQIGGASRGPQTEEGEEEQGQEG